MPKLIIYSRDSGVDYRIELFQISDDQDAVLFIGEDNNSDKGLYLKINKSDLNHIRNCITTIVNETYFD